MKIPNSKFQIPKYKAGFTVLESIVAILVLSLSISGAFSAVQQSLSQSIISKDEIKAFYLAQEAIEIIRNKRESNKLNAIKNGSGNWLDGITQGSSPYYCPFSNSSQKNTCRVDATAAVGQKITTCGIGNWGVNCPKLKQNASSYLYGYLSGDDTNFKREIQIESIGVDEIAVTVQVTWTKGLLITKSFQVKTLLFNW